MAQPPSGSENNKPSPFIHFCEHAKLCSMVVKQLYGITKSRVLRKDVQDLCHSLDGLLQSWKDQNETESTLSVPGRATMQNSQSEKNVELYLRWHELKVTIFHKYKHSHPYSTHPCLLKARSLTKTTEASHACNQHAKSSPKPTCWSLVAPHALTGEITLASRPSQARN
jgi:hypothetical protein